MRKVLPLWLVCILCVHTLFAQSQSHAPTAPLNTELVLNREASLKRLPRDLFEDQVAIWTSPAHLKTTDANWLVPLGIVTGSMIASDRWAPRTLDISPSTQNKFNQFSNAGLAGAFAFSG